MENFLWQWKKLEHDMHIRSSKETVKLLFGGYTPPEIRWGDMRRIKNVQKLVTLLKKEEHLRWVPIDYTIMC